MRRTQRKYGYAANYDTEQLESVYGQDKETTDTTLGVIQGHKRASMTGKNKQRRESGNGAKAEMALRVMEG